MKAIIISICVIFVLAIGSAIFINTKQLHAPEVSMLPVIKIEEPIKETTIYGSWKWIKTVDFSQNTIEPNNPDNFILTITQEGKLTSTTDCNSLMGSVLINQEVMSVGPIAATKKACVEETLEASYTSDLSRAVSYTIEGDILTINQLKDFGVMTFERVIEE